MSTSEAVRAKHSSSATILFIMFGILELSTALISELSHPPLDQLLLPSATEAD
jgi:hypothetical protein